MDVDNVQTNFVTVDGPINIVEDSESVSPIERYDGAPPKSQTGKSISWEATNINTDYEYLRPVVLRRMGVDSELTADAAAYESEKVFQLNDIPLGYGETGPLTLTFTGLEGYVETSTNDIIIDTVSYSKVKTLAQLDGTIYGGNLAGTQDVGYQKYANFIKLEPTIKMFQEFDPYEPILDNLQYGYNDEQPSVSNARDKGYRDIMNTYKYKGYMRDEVYAFYIAFILNDGSMSFAYHIPGRSACIIGGKWENEFVKEVGIDALDKYIIGEFSGQSKYFHFGEFSDGTPQPGAYQQDTRNMNYWENASESYPNTPNYEYWDASVDTINNTTSGNNSRNMQGNPVRHHHFCSNRGTYPTITHLSSPALTAGTASKDFKFYFKDVDCRSYPDNNLDCDYGRLEEVNCGVPVVGKNLCMGSTTCCAQGGICATSPSPGTLINVKWDLPDCVYGGGCNCSQNATAEVLQSNTSTQKVHVKWNSGGVGSMWAGFGPEGAGYWHAPATTVSGVIHHTVQALGFQLEDLKIPQEIAKKVQGFRIYRAKRKHGDRRILGQNNVIPMRRLNSELDDCRPAGPSSGGHTEKFWATFPYATNSDSYTADHYTHFTFHDFYLLRSKSSIAAATHLTLEYVTDFYSFKGYGFQHKGLDTNDHCFKSEIKNNFHIGANYYPPPGGRLLKHVRPLKERCRTYLQGDSIFDGTSLGFGGLISNFQGETSIALAVHPEAALPARDIDYTTFGSAVIGSGNMSYEGVEEELYMVNLHAFKTDMYNSIDTQELVWTGYEVMGGDLDNFVVGGTWMNESTGISFPADFRTARGGLKAGSLGIFGGDTYICRHGWRSTFKPTFTAWSSFNYISGYYNIVESTDNINFRHMEGEDSSYFPGASALSLLKAGVKLNQPHKHDGQVNTDLTDKKNMRYNTNYSQENDVRPAFPLPTKNINIDSFPTRTHRSAKSDPGGMVDNFRIFLANDFKDLPKNRGELWRILSFNNLLYFHMEDTIMKTQGKQTMTMKDGSEAFVGSGDIFAQDPTELVQTDEGYGGTRNQWAGIVTRYGYFFIDSRSSKVFLIQDNIEDITTLGMENWFQENLPFALREYGMTVELDNPTGMVGMGYHSAWDAKHQRILLTKREWIPTQTFIDGCNCNAVIPVGASYPLGCIRYSETPNLFEVYREGKQVGTFDWYDIPWGDLKYYKNGGWTISFNPASKVWISFHDYVPSLWTSTSRALLSIMQNNASTVTSSSTSDGTHINRNQIWEHNINATPGTFYEFRHSSNFEFIDNTAKNKTKVYSSLSYLTDVSIDSNADDSYGTAFIENVPGFTSFFVYNTHQISSEIDIEYMMNVRKIDNEWKLNRFRDMSLLSSQTHPIHVGPFTSNNYGVPNLNVAGTITNNVELTTAHINTMFNHQGMFKTINPSFIDLFKPWHQQRHFTDKFLGIRLICSNNQNNLVNLYSVNTTARESHR